MLKEIPNFSSYFASEDGVIFGTKNQKRMYKLTPYIKNGYKRVRLRKNNKVYDVSVHFLIGMTFIDGYKDGLEINHKNKNRGDNRVENLEWMTHKENCRFSLARKLKVTTKSGCILYYDSCGDFAKDTGISTSNLAKFYMQKKNGYIKKFDLHVQYI